jgi:hypothetical protein
VDKRKHSSYSSYSFTLRKRARPRAHGRRLGPLFRFDKVVFAAEAAVVCCCGRRCLLLHSVIHTAEKIAQRKKKQSVGLAEDKNDALTSIW